jgi:hypothetical protein
MLFGRSSKGVDRDYEKAVREMNIRKNEMDRAQAIRNAKKKIKMEVAINMKYAGRPLSEIAGFTDLSIETIEKL